MLRCDSLEHATSIKLNKITNKKICHCCRPIVYTVLDVNLVKFVNIYYLKFEICKYLQ